MRSSRAVRTQGERRWHKQPFVRELDERSIEVVWEAHAAYARQGMAMTDQKPTKDDDLQSGQPGQPSRKAPKPPKPRKVEKRRKGRKG